MSNLTLNDIKLFLDDLLLLRKTSVLLLSGGATHLKLFTQRRDQLQALPEATLGRPLVDLLTETDALHDGFGRSLFYFTEGYKHLPSLPSSLRSSAEKLQETFIAALELLRARYPDEAARAVTLRPKLTELEPELKSFPIAGGTLLDVAREFIANGEKLGVLLSKRADVNNASDRSSAGKLFSSTLGLIRRVRESLADEREVNPTLPADLETRIFGYLDLLARARAEGAPIPTAPAPAPSTPETPA